MPISESASRGSSTCESTKRGSFTPRRLGCRMHPLAEGFWTLRGIHRVGGLLAIGTQMSVARRPKGRLVLIDGIDLDATQRAGLMALTEDGALVDAIVHVHPFHTLH